MDKRTDACAVGLSMYDKEVGETMETAAKICKLGDKLISFVAMLLIVVALLFGGYSIWDMWSTTHGAFISNDLYRFKPNLDAPEEEQILSLLDLKQINPDLVGWLTVDDTHIDYPVVRGANDSEYLNKTVFGDFSLSGSIFLSCLNETDFTDRYNIIYGHHVQGGAMFADVLQFQNKSFFEKHPNGELILFEQKYRIEFFACVPTDAYDRMFYADQKTYNDDADAYLALLDYIKDNAVQYRDFGLTAEDRIVVFSTCTQASTNGRVLLFGRLVSDRGRFS